MYSRQISEPPESIVRNGKANFGTFSPVPSRLDIRGIRVPFAELPLPSVITNVRIKSRLAYLFSIGNYIGIAEFFDDKIFGLAEVTFWNRETGQKLSYRTLMGMRRRFVPINLLAAACVSYRRSRHIRIVWNRKYNRIALSFNVHGPSPRPPVNCALVSSFTDPANKEILCVTPAPTTRRCSATWLFAMNIRGTLNIRPKHRHTAETQMEETNGLGLMLMNRSYFKFHSKTDMMCGLGETDGRKLIFRFTTSNHDSVDSEQYNDNILVTNGKLTAMPPVCITHPFGVEKKWVVQDTDSMVDLTFTPVSVVNNKMNILLFKTVYYTIYGTFDGVLLTGDGEKITLKSFPGIVKKTLLRL